MELRSGTLVPPPTPADQDAAFREGVHLLLGRWTALQLAVENCWGGDRSAERARVLEGDIATWLYRRRGQVYEDELEDMLDEEMIRSFNTEVEDGSLQEVSKKILGLYKAVCEGNFEPIRELRSTSELASGSRGGVRRSQKMLVDGENDDDDDDEDEQIEDDGVQTAEQSSGASIDQSKSGGQVQGGLESSAVPILTDEEIAEGWEAAPSKGRRGRR